MPTSAACEPPAGRADVLVVGGGPGGSAAAIRCAEAGLSVVLLERETFPRERAGETLHPGVEPLLEQLGVLDAVLAANFLRHEGRWVEQGGRRRFEPFGRDERGTWRGFQAWRAEFDRLLLERARALGVRVLQPCRASGLLTEAGRVCGVSSPRGDSTARFTVDAAGGAQWLARRLGLEVKHCSPRLLARYGYAAGECREHDDAPSFAADEGGWTWVARVRPGVYQWTSLRVGGPERESVDAAAPAALRGLESRGGVKSADVTWRMAPAAAGPGYFLVGDAACVLDPASSHGVLRAIMSGMMAAHLIARILKGPAAEADAARAYRQWLSGWFTHDAEKLREFYRTLSPHDALAGASAPRTAETV